jgi:hypothetical protein
VATAEEACALTAAKAARVAAAAGQARKEETLHSWWHPILYRLPN